jgi:hypothetical protein
MKVLSTRGSGTPKPSLVARLVAARRVEVLRRGVTGGGRGWRLAAALVVVHYLVQRMNAPKVLLRLRIDPGDHLEIRGRARDQVE